VVPAGADHAPAASLGDQPAATREMLLFVGAPFDRRSGLAPAIEILESASGGAATPSTSRDARARDIRAPGAYIAATSSVGAGWHLRAAAPKRACRFFVDRERRRLRGKTAEDLRLLELLAPVAEAGGYEIVRLRLMGADHRRTLQIMAERDDGTMLVEDCTALSRAVSEVLDAADPIKGEYSLEVSSPGIDRPLTRLRDFQTYAGYEARIELDRLADNRKRFKGVLAGLEGDDVAIDLDGEHETTLIPYAWISEAKLVITDPPDGAKRWKRLRKNHERHRHLR
jgi:ribosome maturation factor RimP